MDHEVQHYFAMGVVAAAAFVIALQWWTPQRRARARSRLADSLLRRGHIKWAMRIKHGRFNWPRAKL